MGKTSEASLHADVGHHLGVRNVLRSPSGDTMPARVPTLNVVAYALIAIAMVLGLYRLETTVNRVEQVADENRTSTCRFVDDLQGRYDRTQEYLEEVLAGNSRLPEGVSVSQLIREQEAREQTLSSFIGLCP